MSLVMDADRVSRSLARIAHEIVERNRGIAAREQCTDRGRAEKTSSTRDQHSHPTLTLTLSLGGRGKESYYRLNTTSRCSVISSMA